MAIDVLAALEKITGESTKDSIVRWFDKYMLPNDAFHFSSIDLYAARCGIIHSFSPESDLSRKGTTKKIVYAWGSASADLLRQAGYVLGRRAISVHVRDLIDGFSIAVIKYIDELAAYPNEHVRFFEAVTHWLIGVDPAGVDKLLVVHKTASELLPEA